MKASATHTPTALVVALGFAQIFAWGSSYYLLGVLAEPMAAGTGWSLTWIFAGLSLGLAVAGLISPRMGRAVALRGGRRVLAASTVLIAAGLLLIAAARSVGFYLLGWAVMGLGMGTGLYDAAFAALGQHLGAASRRPITALTLIAGFSSTITWPLSAFMLPTIGWRGVCVAYAGLELAICLPLYLIFAPGPASDAAREAQTAQGSTKVGPAPARAFYILAATITLVSAITAIMSISLIALIVAVGVHESAALGLAALLGPAQVAARLLEMVFARRYRPTLTLVLATGGIAAGIALLLLPGATLPAILLYGGGVGAAWVARGTVPMAIFGPEAYAVQVGRLAQPSLIALAVAPTIGALLMQHWGVAATLAVLAGAALLALGLAVALNRAASDEPVVSPAQP